MKNLQGRHQVLEDRARHASPRALKTLYIYMVRHLAIVKKIVQTVYSIKGKCQHDE